jgi:hypothetical protein
MNDDRDTIVGDALTQLPVPEHRPQFWADVNRARTDAAPRNWFRGTVFQLAAGLAAVALVVAGLAFVRDHRPEKRVFAGGVGAPTTFVGVEEDRVARFEAESGRRLQFLTPVAPYDPYAEPRVAGDTVWAIQQHVPGGRTDESASPNSVCVPGRIVKIDVSGETETVESTGTQLSNLAVTRDGTMVAWVAQPCPYGEPVLRILDTRTETQRSITMGAPPVIYGPPSWARDNRHLAFMARGGGGAAYGVNVIDATTATDIDDAEWRPNGDTCYQEHPQFLDDGTLVALTCSEGGTNNDRVSAMHFAAGGADLGELFAPTGAYDQRFFVDQVRSFFLTPDGKHALYQLQDSDGRYFTYRWDGDSVRRIGTNARDIAW